MRTIEIIPWQHRFFSRYHKSAARYIDSLPSGTTLFLEGPPRMSDNFKKIFGKFLSSPPKQGSILSLKGFMSSEEENETFAYFEIFLIAIRRGLKIVFLDSEHSFGLPRTRENILLRDRFFVQKVLATPSNSREVLLAGAYHSVNVMELLRDNNIAAIIKVDIFDNPEDVLDIIYRRTSHRQESELTQKAKLDETEERARISKLFFEVAQEVRFEFTQKRQLQLRPYEDLLHERLQKGRQRELIKPKRK